MNNGTAAVVEVAETKTARRKRLKALAPDPTPMTDAEFGRVVGALQTICCSEAWIDEIMSDMCKKKRRDRRIRYVTDRCGKITTKMSDLLMELELVGFYPPEADDRPQQRQSKPSPPPKSPPVVLQHIGSQMAPCLSESCTGDHGGELRSILYPTSYLRCGKLCETCYQNRIDLDERAAELDFTQGAVGMSPSAMGIAAAEYYGVRVRWRKTRQDRRPKMIRRRPDERKVAVEE